MADDSIMRMRHRKRVEKDVLEGKDSPDYETFAKEQGVAGMEAPTKSESAEKFWDADTTKRYKAHVAEREKVGGKYPPLEKWAPQNKGKYIE